MSRWTKTLQGPLGGCSSRLSSSLLEQAGRPGGLFNTLIVFGRGRNELGGSLEVQNFLVRRMRGIEPQEGVLQLLHERRVQVAAHRPVVVVIRGRCVKYLDLTGVELLFLEHLVPDGNVHGASV